MYQLSRETFALAQFVLLRKEKSSRFATLRPVFLCFKVVNLRTFCNLPFTGDVFRVFETKNGLIRDFSAIFPHLSVSLREVTSADEDYGSGRLLFLMKLDF
jgi:hypothetical protein